LLRERGRGSGFRGDRGNMAKGEARERALKRNVFVFIEGLFIMVTC
jgi:hypothetical protein